MNHSNSSNLRNYEAMIVMHPDTPDQNKVDLFKNNSRIIKELGGEVHHLDTWGRRFLGNPIGPCKKGFYFHMTFRGSAQSVSELERTMRINDNVLRFLHTRLDDRVDLTKHIESYRAALIDSVAREREREVKFQRRTTSNRKFEGSREY